MLMTVYLGAFTTCPFFITKISNVRLSSGFILLSRHTSSALLMLSRLVVTLGFVYVCQAQQFADHPTEAMLVDVARQAQHRLADCLA